MTSRLDYQKQSPKALAAMLAVENFVRGCGLEMSLIELIKLRASQINGCAYCIDMHTKDARAAGETEQRLYTLSAWRDTPFYTPRERAALEWTEAVTTISNGPIDDALYASVSEHFSEPEMVNMTMAVIAINGWNRLAIPFRSEPGHYEPAQG